MGPEALQQTPPNNDDFQPPVAPPQPPDPMQPQPPMAPQMPQPAGPPAFAPPTAMPAQGGKKKMGIIIAIIAVLVLAGLGVLVYFLFFAPPSKDEIRAASDASSALETKLTAVTSGISNIGSGGDNDTSAVASTVDKAKTAFADFKKADQDFKNQKGLREPTAQKAYQDYRKKAGSFLTYADDYISSSSTLLPVFVKCETDIQTALNQVSSTPQTAINTLGTCATNIKNVDVKDADMKTLRDAAATAFGDYRDEITALSKLSASDLSGRNAVANQVYDTESKFSTKATDITKSFTDHFNNADPTDALRAVSDALFAKSLSTS